MKNFLNKLVNSLRKFMYGRYGIDQLGFAILIFYSLLLIVLNSFPNRTVFFDYFLMILLVVFYYRIFSKNIYKRSKENTAFMRYYGPLRSFVRKKITKLKKMKDYRYFRCPNCKKELRVPKGKGKIEIICPSCQHKFERKS